MNDMANLPGAATMTVLPTDLPDEKGEQQQSPTQEVPGAEKEQKPSEVQKGGKTQQKDVETPK